MRILPFFIGEQKIIGFPFPWTVNNLVLPPDLDLPRLLPQKSTFPFLSFLEKV